MNILRLVEIDGKHYLWRGILEMRRQQRRVHAGDAQLMLFEVKPDYRPPAGGTASGRYLEPSLFDAGRWP
jgi:hypothetical protein